MICTLRNLSGGTMQQKSTIPIYHLQARASRSFELTTLSAHEEIAHWNKAHRDDNYLLIFQQNGLSKLMVDFQEVVLAESVVYAILPGQVHYGISAQSPEAWALAIEPAIIRDNHRMALHSFAFTNKPVPVTPGQCELFKKSILLLQQLDEQLGAYTTENACHAMLEVCISLFITACDRGESTTPTAELRPLLLTRQFRSLLLISFREMKSPSEYAAALNISAAYLNEVVKDTTGYPVSYWIHQEIILEAKRLLFYTNNTVKEISHLLGYTDTTYFIRLFGKTAGMPPLAFRANYRV